MLPTNPENYAIEVSLVRNLLVLQHDVTIQDIPSGQVKLNLNGHTGHNCENIYQILYKGYNIDKYTALVSPQDITSLFINIFGICEIGGAILGFKDISWQSLIY